jgi:hypothetical protein
MCGGLKYEFSGAPALKVCLISCSSVIYLTRKAICHCLTCRRLSGTAFTTNLVIPEQNFKLTRGTPRTFATKQDSGMILTYSFCEVCGVTVSKVADAEAFKGVILVQAGSLDDEGGLGEADPGVELYVSRRVSWLSALEAKGQMWEFT